MSAMAWCAGGAPRARARGRRVAVVLASTIAALVTSMSSMHPAPALGAVISNIVQYKGSVEGGTYLQIEGSGFTRGGLEGSTRVFVGVNECNVIAYYSSDTTMVCVTDRWRPAWNRVRTYGRVYEDVLVRMALVTTFAGASFADCRDDRGCSFRYDTDYTPVIDSVTRSVEAGQVLEAEGYLFGKDPSWFDIRIEDNVCVVDMEVNSDPIIQYSSGDVHCVVSDQEAGYKNISIRVISDSYGLGAAAKAPGVDQVSPDGRILYNVLQGAAVKGVSRTQGGDMGGAPLTIHGTGFGSQPSHNKVKVGGRDCAVTASSTTAIECTLGAPPAPATPASPANSTDDLAVDLSDLPCYNATVVAANATANVTASACNATQVAEAAAVAQARRDAAAARAQAARDAAAATAARRAQAEAHGLQPAVPGGRGLLYEYYHKQPYYRDIRGFTSLATYPHAPDAVVHQQDSLKEIVRRYDDHYGIRARGLFTAPVSANYTFYVRGDDWLQLSLSTDDDPANLREIVMMSRNYYNYWDYEPRQISDRVWLDAGRQYYTQALFQEWGGDDWFRVALRIHRNDNETLADEMMAAWPELTGAGAPAAKAAAMGGGWVTTPMQAQHNSFREVQRIAFFSDVVREEQVLTLKGATGGTWAVTVHRIVDGFLQAVASEQLDWGAHQNDVRTEVRRVHPCGSVSVYRDILTEVYQAPAPPAYTQKQPDNTTITITPPAPAPETITVGYEYRVVLHCARFGPHEDLFLSTSRLRRTSPHVALPALYTFVNRTHLPSEPIRGTYRVGFQGAWTAPMQWDDHYRDMEVALEALPGIYDVAVSHGGDANDGKYFHVTFYEPWGDVPMLQVNDTHMTGSNVRHEVTAELPGSLDAWFDPMPADFFSVPRDALRAPAANMSVPGADPGVAWGAGRGAGVEVWTHGIKAGCNRTQPYAFPDDGGAADPESGIVDLDNDGVDDRSIRNVGGDPCAFLFNDTLTPTLASVSPTSVSQGDALTITGTGFFGGRPDLHRVTLDGAACNVTAVSADGTTITCTVGHSPAGMPRVQVQVLEARGLARVTTPNADRVSYALRIDSWTALNGSIGGQTLVTFKGTGFHRDLAKWAADAGVRVGGVACKVTTADYDSLSCRTPALPAVLSGGAVTGNCTDGAGALFDVWGAAGAANRGANATLLTASGVTCDASVNISGTVLAPRFRYAAALTPTLSSLHPTTFTSAATTEVVMTGTLLHDHGAAVTIGHRACALPHQGMPHAHGADDGDATKMTCRLVRTPTVGSAAADAIPAVIVRGLGQAVPTGDGRAATIRYGFHIESVEPRVGSLAGGTNLTIRGEFMGHHAHMHTVTLVFTVPAHSVPMVPAVPNATVAMAQNMTANGTMANATAGMPAHDHSAHDHAGHDPAAHAAHNARVAVDRVVRVGCTVVDVSPHPHETLRCVVDTPPSDLHNASQPLHGRVHVELNGISAACANGTACNYTLSPHATPTIHHREVVWAARGGPGVAPKRSVLRLNGSHIDGTPTITVGGRSCAILSQVGNSFVSCLLPENKAGKVSTALSVAGLGHAHPRMPHLFHHTYPLRIDGITPVMGSAAGGTHVVVTGVGFASMPSMNGVMFSSMASQGDRVWPMMMSGIVISASHTRLMVMTPSVWPVHDPSQANLTEATVHARVVPLELGVDVHDAEGDHADNGGGGGGGGHNHRMLAALGAHPSSVRGHLGAMHPTHTQPPPGADADPLEAGAARSRSLQSVHLAYGVDTVSAYSAVNFTYDRSFNHTPAVLGVTPDLGFAGTRINVTGRSFGGNASRLEIYIGGVLCAVDAGSLRVGPAGTDRVTCVLGDSPAGTHNVVVRVPGKGWARQASAAEGDDYAGHATAAGEGSKATVINRAFTSLFEVASVSDAAGGLGGGWTLKLHGRGFAAHDHPTFRSHVSLCDTTCEVHHASYTQAMCRTVELRTATSLAALPKVYEVGSDFGHGYDVRAPFAGSMLYYNFGYSDAFRTRDGNPESDGRAWSWSCFSGVDLGAATRGVLYRARFYPRFQRPYEWVGAELWGALDMPSNNRAQNAEWELITTITEAHEGWNHVDINSFNATSGEAKAYRMFRWNNNHRCAANEVEFIGVTVAATARDYVQGAGVGASDGTCNVTAKVIAHYDPDDPNAYALVGGGGFFGRALVAVDLDAGHTDDAALVTAEADDADAKARAGAIDDATALRRRTALAAREHEAQVRTWDLHEARGAPLPPLGPARALASDATADGADAADAGWGQGLVRALAQQPQTPRAPVTVGEALSAEAWLEALATLAGSTKAPPPQARRLQEGVDRLPTRLTPHLAHFALARTPLVTGISPNNGSSHGGDVVTVTGVAFDAGASTGSGAPGGMAPTVSLAGYSCNVTSWSATSITCTSSARGTQLKDAVVSVTAMGGGGTALVYPGVRFRYLDRWSQLSTWYLSDYEPPVDGDTVLVPKGQHILLDVSPPTLFLLWVQGSLIFDRVDGLDVHATYIWVHAGHMEVGTEADPFLNKATITLHGDRKKTIEIPEVGAKVLAVTNTNPGAGHGAHDHDNHAMAPGQMGVLDIHGRRRKRTWVKLNQTAERGATVLRLADEVDWEAGEILIVTSGTRSPWDTEEVEVVDRPDPTTIVLRTGLARRHESFIYYPGDTHGLYDHRPVDMRCEVGLLSRNVVIQGGPESDAQEFGVHTINVHGATYRVENAELRKCGQKGVLGRYCTHLHMAGMQSQSYIQANSIHHSFQRAITVHASHHSWVRHNVAYRTTGHSFFVEDGNERMNVIEENLGAATLPCFVCLSSDDKPATFWTQGPTNLWRHNVAAGSQAFGFWFELTGHPGGPSFTTDLCPVNDHLPQFHNNTGHSNQNGLRMYPTYIPRVVPCDANSGPAPQWTTNFTAFKNGIGIFHNTVGDMHHLHAALVANTGDSVFWEKHPGVVYRDIPNLVHTLHVGSLDPDAHTGAHAVWAPQHEFFYISDSAVVNYGAVRGAFAGCNKCNSDTSLRQGGYTVRFEKLRWINSPKRTDWTVPHKQIFFDLDGTLTGRGPNSTTTPYRAFNHWEPVCTKPAPRLHNRSGLNVATFDGGLVCDNHVRVRRIAVDSVGPRELDWTRMIVASEVGKAEITMLPKEEYGWVVPMVNQRTYHLSFKSLVDFRSMRVRYSQHEYVDEALQPAVREAVGAGTLQRMALPAPTAASPAVRMWAFEQESDDEPLVAASQNVPEWIGFAVNFTDRRWQFQVTQNQHAAPYVDTRRPQPWDPIGTGHVTQQPNKTWNLMMTTYNASQNADHQPSFASHSDRYRVDVAALQCPPNGCPIPPPPTQGNSTRWSDVASWPDLGHVPQAGDAVVIKATQHIIFDMPTTPILGEVTVFGRLEWEDADDRSMHAKSLTVWGSMQIGTEEAPFTHKALLQLYGVRADPTVVVDNSLFLGNKVLVVLGAVDIVGTAAGMSWTRLAAPVAAGDTMITVQGQAGWAVGDEIVLTPTEYYAGGHVELETAKIKTVAASNAVSTTLELEAAVSFDHFQGTVFDGADSAGKARKVVLSAAVGHLARNVVIRGNVQSPTDDYGAHVVVAEIDRPGARPIVGSAVFKHVLFDQCGKMGMEHAALYFHYFGYARQHLDGRGNRVEGCAFRRTFNYGIIGEGVDSLVVAGNVLHNPHRNGVELFPDARNTSITDNLVAGLSRFGQDGSDLWTRPIAAFFLNTRTLFALKGNVVGGSVDAGFTLRAPSCSNQRHVMAMSGNEAHAALVGVHMLSMTDTCVQLDGFTAWKSAHIGILAVDMRANVHVTNAVLSDNHIGASLNFRGRSASSAHTGAGGKATQEAVISGSVVLGSTAASRSCAKSVTCKAQTKSDPAAISGVCGSVFGPGTRRVGLLWPQWTNRGKTCEADNLPVCRPPNTPERMCAMPWEQRYGVVSVVYARWYIHDTMFAHWNNTDCGARSVAVSVNPTQPDYTAPLTVSGATTWHAATVESRARWAIADADFTDPLCQGSGLKSECDSANMLVINDAEGHAELTGVKGGTILGDNPLLVLPRPACSSRFQAWGGGYACPGITNMRQVTLESRDSDTGSRQLGPIRFTRVDPVPANGNRTAFSVGPHKDSCAKRMPFAQFPGWVEPGLVYGLDASNTMPARLRVHFFSPSASEAVLVKMFVQKPNRMNVFVGGVQVQRDVENAPMPTLADPAGTHLFNPHTRTMTFVLRGGGAPGDHAVDIRRVPIIALTMHMEVSLENFFAKDLINNLALLLKIDPKRIKIVGVRLGSVIADIEIEDEAPPTVNDTVTEQSVQRLQVLTARIVELADTGGLDVGYEVLDMTIEPPTVNALPTEAELNSTIGDMLTGSFTIKPKPVIRPKAPQTGLTTMQIVGIAVGGALAFVLMCCCCWCVSTKRHHESAFVRRMLHIDVADNRRPGRGVGPRNDAANSSMRSITSDTRPDDSAVWMQAGPPATVDPSASAPQRGPREVPGRGGSGAGAKGPSSERLNWGRSVGRGLGQATVDESSLHGVQHERDSTGHRSEQKFVRKLLHPDSAMSEAETPPAVGATEEVVWSADPRPAHMRPGAVGAAGAAGAGGSPGTPGTHGSGSLHGSVDSVTGEYSRHTGMSFRSPGGPQYMSTRSSPPHK